MNRALKCLLETERREKVLQGEVNGNTYQISISKPS